MWRLDISRQLQSYVNASVEEQKQQLDLKHSREDIKMFSLTKVSYLEEDIFQYFYPFCLVNCTIATGAIFRRAGMWPCALACGATMEYVYFLFAFPVEAYWFHRRALSTSQPYARFLRESYIEKFPNSWKAECYRQVEEKEKEKY